MKLLRNRHTHQHVIILALISLLSAGCSTTRLAKDQPSDDGKIEVAILQLNDVYEIAGVDGGSSGGLARVAGYYSQVKKQYPQAMMVLAGDFLNPSLIATIRYEGERIKGRQMVEVLNAMDLDLVAFGNHEFDLDEKDLQARINESSFDWIATNIRQVCGDKEYPFYKEVNGKKQFIPETKRYSFVDADGTTLDLGIFSSTLAANPRDYVHYYQSDSCIDVELLKLRQEADVVIGLTHLEISQDIELATNHQEVPLIMGGHEHDNMFHKVGKTVVAKADANAKTVYLHILKYDKVAGTVEITSELVPIDERMPADPVVQSIVKKWTDILDTNVKQVIPNPQEVVYNASTPLDGRESTIRHQQSNMGSLFTRAMLACARNGAVAAILNSGSIRIDDQVAGAITALDIFRALPFGGSVVEIEITGDLLSELLQFGKAATGNGAFLQYTGIADKNGQWYVGEKPLSGEQTYVIAINDFLLKGYDIPFMTEKNVGVRNVYKPVEGDDSDLRNDIRKAIIAFLKKQ